MDIPKHLRNGLRFSGAEELDLANQQLGWNMEWRQLEAGPFEARFAASGENIHYVSERFSRALHILAEPPDRVVGLVLPIIDFSEASVGGEHLQNNEIVVFSPGSELDFVSQGNAGAEAVFLPVPQFRHMLDGLYPGVDLLSPGAAKVFRVDPRERNQLRREIAAIQMKNHSTPEESSLVFARSIQAIMEVCLNRDRDEPPGGRCSAFVARRAREYLEERYTEPLRIEELTRHTGASFRTLQRSFADYFQVSPIQYLKSLRLHKARRMLRLTNPSQGSVTEIALDCGLHHLGRFSTDYRKHFGESPRETLARK